MRPKIITLLLATTMLLATSCQTNQSKNGFRTGLWKTVYQTEPVVYKSRGRFKGGRETGTWKYYLDGNLYKKEKYSGFKAQVWFYYPNKKIASTGQTQLDITKKLTHWYYTGDWKFYNPDAQLVEIRTFKKGTAVKDSVISAIKQKRIQ